MNEFKGKKGDWEVSILNQPMGKHIVNRQILYNLQEKTNEIHSDETNLANAKLIAQAPKLLQSEIDINNTVKRLIEMVGEEVENPNLLNVLTILGGIELSTEDLINEVLK
jgi:flagellar assembly factor FliW